VSHCRRRRTVTGNNIQHSLASRLIKPRRHAELVLVYVGNAIGCLGTVLFVVWSDTASLNGGGVGETAVEIARAKAGLTLGEAFARGVLCNALVCLAVWLAMGGRSMGDKILAVLFPSRRSHDRLQAPIANWFFRHSAWR
jgi:formate/nitrite transporter FocA (FNT family)